MTWPEKVIFPIERGVQTHAYQQKLTTSTARLFGPHSTCHYYPTNNRTIQQAYFEISSISSGCLNFSPKLSGWASGFPTCYRPSFTQFGCFSGVPIFLRFRAADAMPERCSNASSSPSATVTQPCSPSASMKMVFFMLNNKISIVITCKCMPQN